MTNDDYIEVFTVKDTDSKSHNFEEFPCHFCKKLLKVYGKATLVHKLFQTKFMCESCEKKARKQGCLKGE